MIATSYSIGLGLALMGAAYLLTAVIPAVFIREKMFDPHGREAPVPEPSLLAHGASPMRGLS